MSSIKQSNQRVSMTSIVKTNTVKNHLGNMSFSRREFCKLSFNFCCFVTVFFMVAYWFYKYAVQDRDIGVVDYMSFQEASDIEYPVVSLCFYFPFMKQKLQNTNPQIDQRRYLQYLKGKIDGYGLEDTDYENISLDINDYFLSSEELWFNQSMWSNQATLSFDHVTTFSGFQNGFFMKCFSIRIRSNGYHHVKILLLSYSKHKLVEDWSFYDGPETLFAYNLHYPGQFLLGDGIFSEPMKVFNEVLWINEIEILRRRSTYRKKCIDGEIGYDTRTLNRHINSMGCRPPYLRAQMAVPVCNTTKMMKKSKFEITKIKATKNLQDCQIISNVKWERVNVSLPNHYDPETSLILGIVFPQNIKIITLSKEVDIHTLIGNIGGYIGLFLGNFVSYFIIGYSN